MSVERITDDRPVVLRDPAGGPPRHSTGRHAAHGVLKLTHQVSTKNTLQLSYLYDTSTADGEGVSGINQPSNGFARAIDNHLFIANDVAVLSDAVVNELRVQFQRRVQRLEPNTMEGPEIRRPSSVTGRNSGLPFGWDENKLQVTDTITKVTGNHTLKAGANVQVLFESDWRYRGYFGGQYVFDTDKPFNAGGRPDLPDPLHRGRGDPTTSINNNILGLFVEDSWKATRKLTANLGLRYDRESGDVVNVFKSFPDNNNIAPRLSFAWTPPGQPQDVIRGGYGRFYYRLYGNLGVNMVVAGRPAPRRHRHDEHADVIVFPGYPDPNGSQPAPHRRPGGAAQVGRLQRRQRADALRGPAQRRRARELGGIFAISRRLRQHARQAHNPRATDNNYPDPSTGLKPKPDYAQYWSYDTDGRMWYDGLMVRLDKRMSHNYQFSVAYTLAKTEDDTWPLFITQGGGPQSWWNPRAEKAPSAVSGSTPPTTSASASS